MAARGLPGVRAKCRKRLPPTAAACASRRGAAGSPIMSSTHDSNAKPAAAAINQVCTPVGEPKLRYQESKQIRRRGRCRRHWEAAQCACCAPQASGDCHADGARGCIQPCLAKLPEALLAARHISTGLTGSMQVQTRPSDQPPSYRAEYSQTENAEILRASKHHVGSASARNRERTPREHANEEHFGWKRSTHNSPATTSTLLQTTLCISQIVLQ